MVLPDLIADLHATAAANPDHRCDALVGLLDVYAAAVVGLKHLGESDLAAVAAMHARAVAAEMDFPAYTALAECGAGAGRVEPGPRAQLVAGEPDR